MIPVAVDLPDHIAVGCNGLAVCAPCVYPNSVECVADLAFIGLKRVDDIAIDEDVVPYGTLDRKSVV